MYSRAKPGGGIRLQCDMNPSTGVIGWSTSQFYGSCGVSWTSPSASPARWEGTQGTRNGPLGYATFHRVVDRGPGWAANPATSFAPFIPAHVHQPNIDPRAAAAQRLAAVAFPNLVPPQAPQPVPGVVPRRAIPRLPRVAPGVSVQFRQGGNVAPGDVPGQAPASGTAPRVSTPGQTIEVTPQGNITTAGARGRVPPRPGEKEKKLAHSGAVKVVFGAANAITETLDVISALWDALPKSRQTRKRGTKTKPQEKLQDLYDNFDQIDWNLAIQNIALNQLEDFALGKLSGEATKASKPWLERMKRPVSLEAGFAL